ncbi:MAG: class I tRNA ligase family protein, partial [Deltaproteobacteria bacterium]|nr:class I tRNA ligase family protein [Deltaproteobacteria bacterium]
WGPGRPGWHIVCSALATQYLGQPFDIHGGGRDLIFPHHENEIAQSEGAEGKPFAGCWMHNGALTINDEKMSKSLGNIFKTGEAIKQYDVEALRYFLLSNHYRSPLDFTEQAIRDCQEALDRFYEATARVGPVASPGVGRRMPLIAELERKVDAALDDDLNTPKVFAAIFETVRELNRMADAQEPSAAERAGLAQAWHGFRSRAHAVLGLFGSDPAVFRERVARLATRARGVDPAAIERLVAERNAARRAKDFAQSDRLRTQLTAMGVEIKDRPDGTTAWKLK